MSAAGQVSGKELSGREVEEKWASGSSEPWAVMLYTPLCGTCKVALRMLEIAEAVDEGLVVYRCNLNAAPELAQLWRIGSVPCLVRIRGGSLETMYRMESVETMLIWLRQH